MKKTLIALAVAATAAVSGSAMAWTTGGSANAISFEGTLTPEVKDNPWEVQVGNSVTDFEATIQKGGRTATVNTQKNIPVLGIRTVTNSGFKGGDGLNPQINYGGAINISSFDRGSVPVSLTVKDKVTQQDIGTLKTTMNVVSRMAWQDSSGERHNIYDVSSRDSGTIFYGGVGTKESAIDLSGDAEELFPGVTERFNKLGSENSDGAWGSGRVTNPEYTYSAYYASAIKSGSAVTLTLNEPADSSAINWTAQLPITVSYQ